MMFKNILLIMLAAPIFISCQAQDKTSAKNMDSVEIYFVPNNMTTINDRKKTFHYEYGEYGAYFKENDKNFNKELRYELSKLKEKGRGKSGMRIKMILKNKKSTDSVFMSYLPTAVVNYNNYPYKGNPKLLKLVVSKILYHYANGDFVCEGQQCSKDIEKKNVSFLKNMIKHYDNHTDGK